MYIVALVPMVDALAVFSALLKQLHTCLQIVNNTHGTALLQCIEVQPPLLEHAHSISQTPMNVALVPMADAIEAFTALLNQWHTRFQFVNWTTLILLHYYSVLKSSRHYYKARN